MATKQIRYIGFSAQGVEVGEGDWYGLFLPGEPVDVPEEIAGRAPSGTLGDDDYDPGEGLLAQTGNFVEGAVAASTVAEILAEVGDDPSKAAAALAAERARGDHARKTLITQLEAIAGQGEQTNG